MGILDFLTPKTNSEKITDFLVEMYDARLMDTQEGKLAIKKGTTDAIRTYGQLMVKDQAVLQKKLEELSSLKKVHLPKTISDEKSEALEDLKKLEGEDFDSKFKKMITKDHERDVKEFRYAVDLEDKEISLFASQNLPLIEGHLEKIEAID